MQLPEEFLERMKKLVGTQYDAFINSYDTEINSGIRINTLKCKDVYKTAEILNADEKIDWCSCGFYADKTKINGKHPYHAAGAFYFQEPSAMCAAEGLPLCDNPHILDLCAAPGGKTTQIAARMKNRGLLISNEIISKRASILSENVERLGLTNTIVTNESPSSLAERFPLFFDGIIVDAPCSGEGMFRKEPQAAEEWSVAHTLSCAVRQKNILDDAYRMLKPGGYIMYSTCTFSYDENESVVRYMVEKYGMEVCDIPALSMLSSGKGYFPGADKCRRIYPHIQKGEGHFAALLKKTEQCEMPSKKKEKKNAKKNDTELSNAVKLYREFEKKTLKTACEGEFVLFGDKLYLIPEKINTDRIKILRCGLFLGTVKRNRFEPSHSLSHAYPIENYINTVDFNIDSPELKKYMLGDIINASVTGWCVIAVDGMPVGWGKASGGIVKNHYPKRLRILS